MAAHSVDAYTASDVADPTSLVTYAQAISRPYFGSGIAQSLGSMRYLGDRQFSSSAFSLHEQPPDFPIDQHALASVLAYDRDVRRAVDERCRRMFKVGISADFARGRNVDLVAVRPDGDTFSLSNMGAGFGQVVWMAVYLELQHRLSDPVLGVEEPELHLHPALQPAIARILAAYARDGVQQILTTQSEHLLIAFLQLVTKGDLRADELAVYHLKDGGVERLEVDELGRLAGGLKGFFEANETELLDQLDALIRSSGESK